MLLNVLSVICTILAVFMCLFSLVVVGGDDGCFAAFDKLGGAFGFIMTLAFSLTGIFLGKDLIRKNKASSDKKWGVTILVICGIVFLIALFGIMTNEWLQGGLRCILDQGL